MMADAVGITVISRAKAKALGLKRYYTGKPCPHGHMCERKILSKECIQCSRVRKKADYHANKVAEQARMAEYRSDPENRSRAIDAARAFRSRNPTHNTHYGRKWRAENPDKMNELAARKRAIKQAAKIAAPDGFAHEFKSEMLDLYKEARRLTIVTGIAHEVDHVFPLARMGVHAPWNMQVLPKAANMAKHATIPNIETVTVWHGISVSRTLIEKVA